MKFNKSVLLGFGLLIALNISANSDNKIALPQVELLATSGGKNVPPYSELLATSGGKNVPPYSELLATSGSKNVPPMLIATGAKQVQPDYVA